MPSALGGGHAGEQRLVGLEGVQLGVDGLAGPRVEAARGAAPAALRLAVDLHLEGQRLAPAWVMGSALATTWSSVGPVGSGYWPPPFCPPQKMVA